MLLEASSVRSLVNLVAVMQASLAFSSKAERREGGTGQHPWSFLSSSEAIVGNWV